jgi:hypothetical protein
MQRTFILFIALGFACLAATPPFPWLPKLPFLATSPTIDGSLEEWRGQAYCDGWWNMERLRQAPWYEPARNRLTAHRPEDRAADDLAARYYLAWDSTYLYLGAEVKDNVNDVEESRHAPKRWYYKDAIAFFVEAPADEKNETFGQGDHGFAFVIDSTRPDYGAWWRHGTADTSFLEEPLPTNAVDYAIRFTDPTGNSADYMLEARVNMAQTFGQGDPVWRSPRVGDRYRLMIVHCDPDGGEYGGHMLVYGKGDPDESWQVFECGGEKAQIERKKR